MSKRSKFSILSCVFLFSFCISFIQVLAADPSAVSDIIIDNTSGLTTSSGDWKTSTADKGFYGTNYSYSCNDPAATFTYNIPVATSGTYNVSLLWTPDTNRGTNSPVTFSSQNTNFNITINQTSGVDLWHSIGTANLVAGETATINLSRAGIKTGACVIADAVKLSYIPSNTAVGNEWQSTYQDDFNGSSLDSGWTALTNNADTILSGRYPDNVTVSDGSLHLLTKKESIGGKDWTTGDVQSTFTQQYGYYEAHMRIANGPALNNAFWLLAPSNFEIDITEVHFPNYVTETLHDWIINQHSQDSSFQYADNSLSSTFHTYAVDWEPNTITWYYDGTQTKTLPNVFANASAPLRFSTAILPTLASSITDALDGTHMDVDWVRVFTKNPNADTFTPTAPIMPVVPPVVVAPPVVDNTPPAPVTTLSTTPTGGISSTGGYTVTTPNSAGVAETTSQPLNAPVSDTIQFNVQVSVPAVVSTPVVTTTKTSSGKTVATVISTTQQQAASSTVVSIVYTLDGKVIHTTTAFPDTWNFNTHTIPDGAYNLTAVFHYADGSTQSSITIFTVENGQTFIESVKGIALDIWSGFIDWVHKLI